MRLGLGLEKIGIITLGGRFNYGNRLQNYATDRVWRKMGFVPVTLLINDRPTIVRRLKGLARKVLAGETPNPEAEMSELRLAAFDAFNEEMAMATVSGVEVACLVDEYRYFSVGSDQVWNPWLIANKEGWFFLDFARPDQRIALAPSIGLDALQPKQANLISRGVSHFSRLSIREERGAELIRECSGAEAEIICDPTLVLTAEEWRNIAAGGLTPDYPYVFTYLLGGVGAEAMDVLDKVTDRGRIPVVPLSDRQKPGEPDAGPAEFIDLIDHAAHVVTDSFHAAVFSSILQTPLTIVHREGASMFSRLEQLSKTLGIEEKIYGSPTYDLGLSGEYDGVPEAIERERDGFMAYLRGCLNG